MILGFDTSTAATSACLLADDGTAFEWTPPADRLFRQPGHSRELMPALASVLREGGVRWRDLDAIAVGVGPGTFTGLRIGIATAHGIARAHRTPLRPVSSLAALAAGIEAEMALPLLDARRGEVFGALYRGGEMVWEPFVASPPGLAERLRNSGFTPLAAGDGSIRFRETVESAGARVAPDDAPSHVVSGLHVCRLGRDAPDAEPEAVLPQYLRAPDAKPR